ncbi:helix-turn-helix transcriptional regulator [Craterilacuibacter sinensis]|uniref:HTH luxR-type domain-containing protein n=1 Tax=Craterilacuibacter sinensis TaxID=2686017 RepID=A0A845BNY4_9NEIS|nr:LuxR family transcriptional regulator [Craterilacuibacter sinensis]MXR38009.1 hypothetical protein [Craterilacuibacter sinensis]
MNKPSATQLYSIVESVDDCDMHFVFRRVKRKTNDVVTCGVDQAAVASALLNMMQSAAQAGVASEDALAKLTPREKELSRFLQLGASNKQLALQLGCSVRTVRAHIENMQRKTGTANRLALVAAITGIGFSANMKF